MIICTLPHCFLLLFISLFFQVQPLIHSALSFPSSPLLISYLLNIFSNLPWPLHLLGEINALKNQIPTMQPGVESFPLGEEVHTLARESVNLVFGILYASIGFEKIVSKLVSQS